MSYDEHDDETLRERIESNPRPALLWLAGVVVLVALELGRIARGLLYIGGAVRYLIGGILGVPSAVANNVAGTLGYAAGAVAGMVTWLLLLAVVAVLVKWLFVPVSLVETLGIQRETGVDEVVERGLITGVLALVVALLLFTPLGGVLDAVLAALAQGAEALSGLQTLTQRTTIPNEGYRSPDGGWEGTFLGLSPAWAWAVRVVVIFAYAFVVLAWAWKGYDTYREHYREADWTPRDDSIDRFRTHYWGIFGLAIVFAFVVMAIYAPSLGPVSAEANLFQPYEHEFQYLDEGSELQTVSHGTANIQTRSQGGESNVGPMSYDEYGRWHPMGTNQDGKDLFTFLMYGARTSLVIGITAIGLGVAIALALSLVTAYYKGLVDVLTIIASDTIISIPAFLLVLLLSVIFQEANHPVAEVYDGGLLLALIFALVYWPGLWRSIRGPSLQVAEQEWVDAAKSYGQTPGNTMRKHMAPYIVSYIMIYASLLLGGIIIATAALSFLGLGINPPTPEWGRAVAEGRNYVPTRSWHISTVPGVMIVFVVTGFNALGDGIRDVIDPESEVGGTADATAAGGGG
jgi:peptide/nickel transport system permease protein